MDFKTSITTCFKKYGTIQGRASRSEYWYFVLFYSILFTITIFLSIASETLGLILNTLVGLGFLIPLITAGVRRLHDIDKSGWFMLLSLIPLINFVLLYFFVKKGTEGTNKFGENPLTVIE